MALQTRHLEFAPPPAPGFLRAFGLAILAHAALVAALTWGVSWKSQTVEWVAEAELWAQVPVQAAPKLEEALPPPGNSRLLAADSQKRLTLNSADPGVRARYAARMLARRMQLAGLGRQPRLRVDELCVDEPAANVLTRRGALPGARPLFTPASLPADQPRG